MNIPNKSSNDHRYLLTRNKSSAKVKIWHAAHYASVVLRLYTTTWTHRRLASNANIVITSSPSVFMQVAQYGALELRVCHVPVSGRISTRWCTLWAADEDRAVRAKNTRDRNRSQECRPVVAVWREFLVRFLRPEHRKRYVGKPFLRKISCRWTLDDCKTDFWKL